MISIDLTIHCDAPNCREQMTFTHWSKVDFPEFESIARQKGWNCGASAERICRDVGWINAELYKHLCPECSLNPERHLP